MPFQRKKRLPIFSYYSEELPESIEFQRTYSRLKNAVPNAQINNLIVTSATKGEGKSTTSAFLAITISKYQLTETLLVDFDLRNPKLHQIFDVEKENGVGEIIEGKKAAKACFKKTPLSSLKILTCGNITEPFANIFDVKRIKKFFDEIKFYFNTIIIDSAPVIAVSDALILSTETDGVVLVVRAGTTPREVVKRARNLILDAGAQILGVVLNDMEEVLPNYYKYDYYA